MTMDLTHSAKVLERKARLEAFMDEHVYPNEAEYDAYTRDHNNLWTQPAVEARFQRILDAYDLIPG